MVREKYNFLHEDKQSLPRADSIVFKGQSWACTNYPKQQVCNIFSISHKRGRNEVNFLHAGKSDPVNLGGHGKMLKLPKITNLHNLCDISERSGK